jgi:minimal PKS acyl carrier protein
MPQLTLQGLQDIMRECAGEEESAKPFDQAADESFDDLGYDSIALLETQSRVSQDYGVEISEEDLADLTTPREFVDHLNAMLTAA